VAIGLKLKAVALAGVALLGFILATPAQAESLADAMRAAYQKNPTLRADRARQRGTDELVPTAKSGWRPTVTAQKTLQRVWRDSEGQKGSGNTSVGLDIQLSQPVFRGFKTVEGIKSAKATVEAGRQQLLATEQSVLFEVTAAYLAVVRDKNKPRQRLPVLKSVKLQELTFHSRGRV
jgi:outer membrane protein